MKDSDEAVMQLEAMGIGKMDAVACLKACNNDLARAAEYYWNGDLEKARDSNKWCEEVWSVPREGAPEPTAQSGHSFNNNYQAQSHYQIQSQDVLAPSGFEGAKSRPPSRMSNRIDLTGTDENGVSPYPGRVEKVQLWLTGDTGSDPDLARALAASMQDSSGSQPGVGFGQQESGITGTHTSPTSACFGPARPDQDYDPGQWALTTTQTHEIFLDPSPADRERNPDEPAFFKFSTTTLNLPACLVILHAIPTAREGFLARDFLLPDYGHDDQWWNGQRIQTSRIINLEDENPDSSEIPELVVEVQRLMAFLDKTQRAYGSVESLATIPRSREDLQTGSIDSFFLEWSAAIRRTASSTEGADKILKPFTSVAIRRNDLEQNEGPKQQFFNQLDVVAPSSEQDNTLYGALDRVIWYDEELAEDFVNFADVFCVQVRPNSQDGQDAVLDVPVEFYPDRYTDAWAVPARHLKKQIATQRRKLETIEERLARLSKFKHPSIGMDVESHYEPKALVEVAVECFESSSSLSVTGMGEDVTMESQVEGPDIALALKEILKLLEKNLSSLSAAKLEAGESLRKLQASFTSPETTDPSLPPLTRYTLRGVCADPRTIYVLKLNTGQQAVQSSGASSCSSATVVPDEQWWSFSWGSHKTAPTGWDDNPTASYEVKKVTEKEVLEAAKVNGDIPLLLVYANEKALKPNEGINNSLPEPLQTFVERDNAAFQLELQPGSGSPERKRRHEEGWFNQDYDDDPHHELFSPKKSSTTRSSATLGMNTPVHSRRNSLIPTEIEMTEGVEKIPEMEMIERARIDGVGGGGGGGGDGSNGKEQRTIGVSIGEVNTIEQTLGLSPRDDEMAERSGHISPVAKAFHLDSQGKDRDLDDEMVDIEHVEFMGQDHPKRKGG